MFHAHSDALSRLRAANPAQVDADRGRDVTAQAALQRLLLDVPADGERERTRPIRRLGSARGLALVLAMLVLGVGGAVAATDPFGWSSPNPGEAQYGANPLLHVKTPGAQQIRCKKSGPGRFSCTAERLACHETATRTPVCGTTGAGLSYDKIDAVPPPIGPSFSRASLLSYISHHIGSGAMTPAHAEKFRADLARVPDSFFTEFRLASRFGTYNAGSSNLRGHALIPPRGVPAILVCVTAAPGLSCRALNGDLNAPIGAGVYAAQTGPGWRLGPPHRRDAASPPGVHFTAAEYAVLVDMLRYATTSQSSGSSGQATPIPITPSPPAHRSATG